MTAHSNPFHVKNQTAFITWVYKNNLEIRDDNGRYTLIAEEGWLTNNINQLIAELAPHLADGEVAVLKQSVVDIGKYAGGFAVAVHASGKFVEIALDDIYRLAAAEFGIKPWPESV